LQKQLKELVKGNFVFRNTRNGTRIVANEMADLSAIKSLFDNIKNVLLYIVPKISEACKGCDTTPPTEYPCEGYTVKLV
jgi:hypothetical protein